MTSSVVLLPPLINIADEGSGVDFKLFEWRHQPNRAASQLLRTKLNLQETLNVMSVVSRLQAVMDYKTIFIQIKKTTVIFITSYSGPLKMEVLCITWLPILNTKYHIFPPKQICASITSRQSLMLNRVKQKYNGVQITTDQTVETLSSVFPPSWYHIQSGDKRTLPSPPALLIHGGLGVRARCWAGLEAVLAGCVGVGVPRPIAVGAVANGLLVDVHTLPRWDHPVPSKAVGT